MPSIAFDALPVSKQCDIALQFARGPGHERYFSLPVRNARIASPALHDSIRAQMIESFIDRVTAAKAACSDGNEEAGKKMLVDVIGDELDPENPILGHLIYYWWATTASARTQTAPS